MGALEVISMVAALILMFAAVAVKVMAAQLLGSLKQRIARVSSDRQQALGRLKMVQSQKQVAEQNKASLLNKKNKLAKRLNRLKRELDNISEEEEARRQRSEMRKVE